MRKSDAYPIKEKRKIIKKYSDKLIVKFKTVEEYKLLERTNNQGPDSKKGIQPCLKVQGKSVYLITRIGVLEWKIIRRAILGLNRRAKIFRL